MQDLMLNAITRCVLMLALCALSESGSLYLF